MIPFQQYESLLTGSSRRTRQTNSKPSSHSPDVELMLRRMNKKNSSKRDPFVPLVSLLRDDHRLRPGSSRKLDLLLDYLERNRSRIQTTVGGNELVLDGKRIPRSNSRQLINKLIGESTSDVIPRGWTEFSVMLQRTNAPRELYNEDGYRSMDEDSDHLEIEPRKKSKGVAKHGSRGGRRELRQLLSPIHPHNRRSKLNAMNRLRVLPKQGRRGRANK